VDGRPARVSDPERELAKHLVVRLTNAVTSMDVRVVRLGKYQVFLVSKHR
jgi:hypothetical protein